jgi:hypothetical protein
VSIGRYDASDRGVLVRGGGGGGGGETRVQCRGHLSVNDENVPPNQRIAHIPPTVPIVVPLDCMSRIWEPARMYSARHLFTNTGSV